jgi:hypothetical protein
MPWFACGVAFCVLGLQQPAMLGVGLAFIGGLALSSTLKAWRS